MLVSILNRFSCSYNNRRSHSGTFSSRSRSRSHSRSPSPRRHPNHGPPSPLLPHLKSKQRSDDLHQHSRHGHKRKRSRSRSRSTSKPRERDRERERERDRGSSDLAKKHKHERSSGAITATGGNARARTNALIKANTTAAAIQATVVTDAECFPVTSCLRDCEWVCVWFKVVSVDLVVGLIIFFSRYFGGLVLNVERIWNYIFTV